MRLDPTYLTYITKEEMRVLLSVEMGMRNHEFVPVHLIEKIAHLGRSHCYTYLKLLLKNKLVYHQRKTYDGYKLTYLGYDYLALHVFMKRGVIKDIIGKIGVGKESDIYKCTNSDGEEVVLKFARLGRVSFKTVKNNRDYIKDRTQYNWLYLSRLQAVKEYSFMEVLYKNGFPTPTPYSQNRHGIVMSLIDGKPMVQVKAMKQPQLAHKKLIDMIVKLAEHGLIHGDFNEFNLLINSKYQVTVIDFPQMISTNHLNGKYYFDRDIACIHRFFEKKMKFVTEYSADWDSIKKVKDLDEEVRASGFMKSELDKKSGKKDLEVLEQINLEQMNEQEEQEWKDKENEDSNEQEENFEESEEEEEEEEEKNEIKQKIKGENFKKRVKKHSFYEKSLSGSDSEEEEQEIENQKKQQEIKNKKQSINQAELDFPELGGIQNNNQIADIEDKFGDLLDEGFEQGKEDLQMKQKLDDLDKKLEFIDQQDGQQDNFEIEFDSGDEKSQNIDEDDFDDEMQNLRNRDENSDEHEGEEQSEEGEEGEEGEELNEEELEELEKKRQRELKKQQKKDKKKKKQGDSNKLREQLLEQIKLKEQIKKNEELVEKLQDKQQNLENQQQEVELTKDENADEFIKAMEENEENLRQLNFNNQQLQEKVKQQINKQVNKKFKTKFKILKFNKRGQKDVKDNHDFYIQ